MNDENNALILSRPRRLSSVSLSPSPLPTRCPLCKQLLNNPGDVWSVGNHFAMLANFFPELTSRALLPMSSPPPSDPPIPVIDGYFDAFFIHERTLGHGAFGTVELVTHHLRGVPLGVFAVKKVALGDHVSNLELHGRLNEILTMVQLPANMYLVKYVHCWAENSQHTAASPRTAFLYILLEYADGGSLAGMIDRISGTSETPMPSGVNLTAREKQRLVKVRALRRLNRDNSPPAPFPLAPLLRILADAARGLAALHAVGYLHRDLKPANILLTLRDQPPLRDRASTPQASPETIHRYRGVLADFGQTAPAAALPPRTGGTGTADYAAPELAQGRGGAPADVYALGVSIREVLDARNGMRKWDEIREDVERELMTLVEAATIIDPQKRIQAEEIAVTLERIADSCLEAQLKPESDASDETEITEIGKQNNIPDVTGALNEQLDTVRSETTGAQRRRSLPRSALACSCLCAGILMGYLIH